MNSFVFKSKKLMLLGVMSTKLFHVVHGSATTLNQPKLPKDSKYQCSSLKILHDSVKIPFLMNSCLCSSSSLTRHLYHAECESSVNQQIAAELNAAYAYLSMASYFGRTDVALPGCHGFFLDMHEEEITHALTFLKYQNLRGGKVVLQEIVVPQNQEWNIEKALETGLEMEKTVKEKLIEVHDCAEKHHDLNLMDMVVTDFIEEQERSICEFGRLLSRYKSMKGCGNCSCVDYLFDKEFHETFVRRAKKECPDPKKLRYT